MYMYVSIKIYVLLLLFEISNNFQQNAVHFINSKFDLEESFSTWPDCPDHVVIRDGTNSWSKKLKTLCGGQSDWEDEIESSGNGMRVEFRTNKDHSAAGFFAKYTTSLLHDGNFFSLSGCVLDS